ncbi:MAG TPA: L-threonylcarbamoyladenylate synthase [Candidatus Limnocylindrales bacterium]|nr:L-threonylcarbamoyladenylate synthase [Candidatus Limnocylindrales bacterium]
MAELISSLAPGAIERAAECLRGGGVISVPTETVYGVAVLPNEAGVSRLIEAKRRSAEKGIQLLIDSLAQARAIAQLPPAAMALAERYWPGPLTLVLDRRPDVELPAELGGGRPTLGLRLPDHHVPRALARLLGPIAASSANVSGQPDATTAQQVLASLGEAIELVIDDGPVRGGVPSTVVACLAGEPARVLREGALSERDVRAATATLDR